MLLFDALNQSLKFFSETRVIVIGVDLQGELLLNWLLFGVFTLHVGRTGLFCHNCLLSLGAAGLVDEFGVLRSGVMEGFAQLGSVLVNLTASCFCRQRLSRVLTLFWSCMGVFKQVLFENLFK